MSVSPACAKGTTRQVAEEQRREEVGGRALSRRWRKLLGASRGLAVLCCWSVVLMATRRDEVRSFPLLTAAVV